MRFDIIKGKEEFIKMKLVSINKKYQGKYLSYYVATYLLDNNEIKEYELVSRNPRLNISNFGKVNPAGVGMVTYSEDKKKILLQKEFRMATNNYVYNFPAGLIDEGESPIDTARRELKEETGLDLIEIIDVLPPSFAAQGTSDEMMYIVICTCKGDLSPSIYAEEEISASWYDKNQIKQLLDNKAYMSVRTQMYLYSWVNQKD